MTNRVSIESPGPTAPLSPNARLRFDVVRRILNQIGRSGAFLEIGCGQGALAAVLAQHFEYVGYEPDPVSYKMAATRLRGIEAARVVNDVLPAVVDRRFQFLGAFEVLEHLEDDHAAMRQWAGWLRPGGHAVVSVPAHPDRFGPADVRVGHFRRYTRSAILDVMTGAGLTDIRAIAYGFPLGYLLEWARNRIASRDAEPGAEMQERTSESGRFLQPPDSASPLIWAGTWPFLFLQRPFSASGLGTGWVAYGRAR